MDLPRRHHYIPQLLLRGFASRTNAQDTYVWMFRRDIEPKETNTKNVAQQRDFHGNPNTSQLEYQLREYETEFGRLIDTLRNDCIREQDVALIRAFIANLLIRTKNLRAGFERGTTILFDKVGEAIPRSNKRKWKHKLQKAARKEFRENGLQDAINKLPIAQRRRAKQLIKRTLQQIDLRQSMGDMLQLLRQHLDIPSVVANAHVRVLTENIVPQPRIESIAHLHWELVRHTSKTLILGDVGVIGQLDGPQLQSLFNLTGAIKLAILPISDSICLIGSSQSAVRLPSAEEINLASAELSREFFIAAQMTERERAYHQRLGIRAEVIGEDEISEIVNDLM